MSDTTKTILEEQIANIFDGLQLNLNLVDTVGTLLELVVHNEFKEVAEYLPNGNILIHPALTAAA